MKVLVLGAHGMLGSMVCDVLEAEGDLELTSTARGPFQGAGGSRRGLVRLDAETASAGDLEAAMAGCDWAINCIGIIKPYIHDDQAAEVERAIRVNALFPHALAKAASSTGCRVIQIATDCVYSGQKGAYIETEPHDALDVYGKTKSLGECRGPGVHHIRCSIIGPEQKDRRSLLEWFLGHPKGATLSGYTNHLWNGLTTLHFARICLGIMRSGVALPPLAHVLPSNTLSKGELLLAIGRSFGRGDLQIELKAVTEPVNRSLGTLNPALNWGLWASAGYPEPPSLGTMIDELAHHVAAFKGSNP